MDHQEKIIIGLLAAVIVGLAYYIATRPTQIDISPRPDKPLSDDTVGESEHAPTKNETPSVSAYHGMFLYPLAFSRPMPVVSKRMQ